MEAVIPAEWRRLTNNHRDVLTVLAIDGGQSVREIHDAIGPKLSYQAVGRNVSRLSDMGLVETEIGENGRCKRSWLTDDGHEVVCDGLLYVAGVVREAEP